MSSTKENILTTALRLFARDGYEAVSVSAIAGELGITKGALYRHYESKRDIFDSLVRRMIELDAERARQFDVPEAKYAAAPEAYHAVSAQSLNDFTLAQLVFWTQDAFAAPFRRMLVLEQYRSEEMAALYNGCLVAGPADYTADIFRAMMNTGQLRPGDATLLAMEYCAPLFWLIGAVDHGLDAAAARARLQTHIDHFWAQNATQ